MRQALFYLGVGLAWVAFTAWLMAGMPPDWQAGSYALFGAGFVALSALVIYSLQKTAEQAQRRYQERLEESGLFQQLFEKSPAIVFLWRENHLVLVNPVGLALAGYTLEELRQQTLWDLVHPEDRERVQATGLARLRGEAAPDRHTFRIRTRSGEVRWLDYRGVLVDYQGQPAVLAVAMDITERKRQERVLTTLNRVNEALGREDALEELATLALASVAEATGAQAGSLLLVDEGRLVAFASRGWMQGLPPPRLGEGLTGLALRGEEVVSGELGQDARANPAARPFVPPGWGGVVLPLGPGARPIGALSLAWPHPPYDDDLALARLLVQPVAGAVHRAWLRRNLEQQVAYLQAAKDMARAILSTLDQRVIRHVFQEQVAHLPLDALVVFLRQPHGRQWALWLDWGLATPRASRPQGLPQIALRALDQGLPQRFELGQLEGEWASFAQKEGLQAGQVYPLQAKGHEVGLLLVFTRGPWALAPGEESFLQALADQAALAIDNAQTYQRVRASQSLLLQAYEHTLWALARGLELRDQETAGHTERVVALGLRLAQAMGLKGEGLEDFRRGAILHDVGKIGIPDQILKKPGPLTPEEWATMRLHPVYAYEWLKEIPYLGRALEIPYAHHERWDGSGYPRGLKGEAIPLSARIFAVVDVYDALTSDRPYRAAWPREKALAYLQAEAGRSFDPQVVSAFLRLIQQDRQAGQAS